MIYDGERGWSETWCQRLSICSILKGFLLGEVKGLNSYYFLSTNEEVAFTKIEPNTTVGIHNGGSNTRVNIDLMLSDPYAGVSDDDET